MILPQWRSVLTSVNQVATKVTGMLAVLAGTCGHFDVQGQGRFATGPLPLEAMVTSEPRLRPRAMSGFCDPTVPGSGLLSMAPNTTKGCANTQDLGHYLRSGGDLS